MSKTFRVTYVLTLAKDESPAERILALQLEQSAELPDTVVGYLGMDRVKGIVTRQEELDERHLQVTIAWPRSNHGGEITQFLNLLFGNISMKQGIAIVDIAWEDVHPELFCGPAWGISRIRNEWAVPRRALSCTAIKPMGFDTLQLADLTFRFALGGIDIIKDDHGLADQPSAPFLDRVKACVRAVDQAAQKSGRRSRYFPNITTDPQKVSERYEMAAELGADGVLLTPMLTGPALMHHLARSPVDLPIIAHPAFSGSFIAHNHGCPFHYKLSSEYPSPGHPSSGTPSSGHPTSVTEIPAKNDNDRNIPEIGTSDSLLLSHGFDAALFYGALYRALGADFVIYPNTGGRFAFQPDTCEAINNMLRRTDLPFSSSFPTPGGGMKRDRMSHWLRTYGPDTTFLIGGSLYEHPDGIESASRAFMECITDIP